MPGLYLMGTTFLRRRKSTLIDGAGDDARDLSAHLCEYLGQLAKITMTSYSGRRSLDEVSVACPMVEDHEWGFRTRAVHAGNRPDAATGARAVPIYQTTSFVFEDAADAADLFALQKYGNIYTRIANPTVAAFEERMASLEGGIGAVATSSGQAAELLLFTALAGAGDHIVASAALYGGTHTLLDVSLRRLGIETTFVAARRSSGVRGRRPDRRPRPSTPRSSPTRRASWPTWQALAEVAHAVGVPLVVDSTLATPYLCRPFEHGADVVVHSATKFIGGHGTSIGGVVVESGRFDWANGRFPRMTEPVASYGGLRFWDNFGEYGFCTQLRVEQLRDFGTCLAPLNAFLLLQGLETLGPADGRPRGQRPGPGRAPRRPSGRGLGVLRRPDRLPPLTPWPGATCPRARGRCSPSGSRRAGRRPRPSSKRRAGQPPGQHRRHPHPGDPPGVHHPPAALRRGAGRRRRRRRPGPGVGRHRGPRRHRLGLRPGPRRRVKAVG